VSGSAVSSGGDPLPFRFVWTRAIQDSDLRPTVTLVAYAFGQFIGADKKHGPEAVWLSLSELQRITRLSRDAANRGTRELRDAGWLVPVTPAAQHRSVIYRAVVPGDLQYGRRTAEEYASRTAEIPSGTPADTSGTPDDISGTGGVPHKERTRKEKEGAPPLTCERHPHGSRGLPCRSCGAARRARRIWEAGRPTSAGPSDQMRPDDGQDVGDAPDCPHGIPGGDLHRPWLTGYSPRCATCRRIQPHWA
jgi:hypothetical protein